MAGPTSPAPFLMGTSDTPPVTPVNEIVDELQGNVPADDTTTDETATETATDASTDDSGAVTSPEPTMEQMLADALGVGPAVPPVVGPESVGEDGEGGGLAAEVTTPAATADTSTSANTAEVTITEPVVNPASGVVDINTLAEQMYGRPLTQQEAYNLFALSNDLSRLTPQQAAQVEAIVYGTPQPMASTPANQPAPTQQVDQPDDLDPDIAAALAPIQQQLQAVQSFVQEQSSAQLEAQRAQARAAIDATATTFATSHELTAEESQSLQYQVAQSGIFPGLVQRHNGDVSSAMSAALDMMYWQTPTFREREVAKSLASEQQQISTTMAKANKAASLAPGGAHVSREDPPPSTPEARQAAMVAELSKAMDQ